MLREANCFASRPVLSEGEGMVDVELSETDHRERPEGAKPPRRAKRGEVAERLKAADC